MRGIAKVAATAGICATLLSGCTPVTTDESIPVAGREAETPPTVAVKSKPAKPSAKPIPRVAVKIDDNPRRLLGLDVKSLTGLLGAPRFTRRDPPAQLWRYRDKGCVLDLFLYEDTNKKSRSTVRHYEARSLSNSNFTARSCLRALLIARQKPKAG